MNQSTVDGTPSRKILKFKNDEFWTKIRKQFQEWSSKPGSEITFMMAQEAVDALVLTELINSRMVKSEALQKRGSMRSQRAHDSATRYLPQPDCWPEQFPSAPRLGLKRQSQSPPHSIGKH